MAKKMYAIVDGKTKKVRKNYTVVNGKIKKVRKGYTVVAGKIRPFWTGGELEYYGTVAPLSVARSGLAATTVGNYALFGGGSASGERSSVVDAYTQELTRSTALPLVNTLDNGVATTVGNYAIFAGGISQLNDPVDNSTAFNSTLTKTLITPVFAVSNLSATTVGNYALFAGGYYNAAWGGSYSGAVHGWDKNLTYVSVSKPNFTNRSSVEATTVGNHALFAGGYKEGTFFSSVDVYSPNLTKEASLSLSDGKEDPGATTVGDYAIFAGGNRGSTGNSRKVDAFNASLTRISLEDLSFTVRGIIPATTIGEYAIFIIPAYNVFSYDINLTRRVEPLLSNNHYGGAATTIGSYALFAGGAATDAVDAYTA